MPKLSEVLNVEANPQITANIRHAFDIFRDDVNNVASTVNAAARQIDVEPHTDLRETGRMAWSMANDLSLQNFADDPGFRRGLSYTTTTQAERENILDDYYDKLRSVDFRNMDYSCLTGQDNSFVIDGELSTSEHDVIQTVVMAAASQNYSSKANENPEYYLNRRARLTPKEIFREQLNDDYVGLTKDAITLFILQKNGYSPDLKRSEANQIEVAYQRDINLEVPLANSLTCTQRMEVMEQVYAYKMARLNGEPDVPEPKIAFHTNPKWNMASIDRVINAFNNNQQISPQDGEMVDSMADVICHPMKGWLDKPKDDAFYDNIFVDGVSLKEYCATFAPANLTNNNHKADKFYSAQLLKALYSGEHNVETSLRYMDENGKMKADFVKYEPDLTLLAQREKVANHSWFRRTFFDWGPFKITTCKSKQAKLKAADTIAKAAARHQRMEERYHILSQTNDHPNNIYKDSMPSIIKNQDKVQDLAVPDFQIWAADKISKSDNAGLDFKENIYNNALHFNGNDRNCNYKSVFLIMADKYGIGNAMSVVNRLSKGKLADNLVTEKQKEMLREVTVADTFEINTAQKRTDIVNDTIEYYLRNGGIENENGSVTLEILDSISEDLPQHHLVKAFKNLSEPTKQIDEKCGQIAKALNADPNATVSNEDIKYLQDKYVEQKVNKMLCDKLSKFADKKKLDLNIYKSAEANTIVEYLGNKDKPEYKKLVSQVKEEYKGTLFKNDSAKEVLTTMYRKAGKLNIDIKNSIQTVLDKAANKQLENQPQALENANVKDNEPKQKEVKHENKVVVPVG